MMKKIIAAALALTLSMSMGNFAYAAEGGSTVPAGGSADIKATYQAGTETAGTVYSVDVKWGSLEYRYNSGATKVWDPETLMYKETSGTASWTCESGEDQITVTNNSNVPVKATFSYEQKNSSGITGTFDKAEVKLATAVGTEVNNAPSDTVKLTLDGEFSSDATEKTEIGSVTVSIKNNNIPDSSIISCGNSSMTFYYTETPNEYIIKQDFSAGNNRAVYFAYIEIAGKKYTLSMTDNELKNDTVASFTLVEGTSGTTRFYLPSNHTTVGHHFTMIVNTNTLTGTALATPIS